MDIYKLITYITTLGPFVIFIAFFLYNIFTESQSAKYKLIEKIYSFTFLFIFFGGMIVSIWSSLNGNDKLTLSAFITCVVSIIIFILSGFLMDYIKVKKLDTKKACNCTGVIIGLNPRIKRETQSVNGEITHEKVTYSYCIIFEYVNNEGETKTCETTKKYTEQEVTYLLNYHYPISISAYENICKIKGIDLSKIPDEVDKELIEEMSKKYKKQ